MRRLPMHLFYIPAYAVQGFGGGASSCTHWAEMGCFLGSLPVSLGITSILDDSAPHNLSPMPIYSANAGSSVPYTWQA